MGVVRDVTVDNLVTAVGNIDTSTLAQDSTLQDVATAIGNISGGSDPVTNTTVNSLCKDTTGQSIATAISGLATSLGSDRALIDGSNIANPSAFRQNIGLTKSSTTLGSVISNVFRQDITKDLDWVCVYVELLGVTATSSTTVGVLPEGYRPTHRIMQELIVINSSTARFIGYAHADIQPTGTISITMNASYNDTFCTINAVFPTA